MRRINHSIVTRHSDAGATAPNASHSLGGYRGCARAHGEIEELPELVVSSAIMAGATPLAIETAVTKRGEADTVLVLCRETGVELLLIHELAGRWGIRCDWST